jgi:hypothetical protein
MSDFSELCPLFTTGLYKEFTIGPLGFTGLSSTMNAMMGAVIKATKPCSLKFDRTVVVTKIYVHQQTTNASSVILLAKRHLSAGTAAGTVFASLVWSTTTGVKPLKSLHAMTQSANKTFLAADVLGFANKTKKTNGGRFSFIVRYKEK